MSIEEFAYMHNGIIKANASQNDIIYFSDQTLYQKINPPSQQRALLCLHGFSSTPAVFRYLLPLLLKYDTISIPILPGHGCSIQEFSTVTAKDWLFAVEASYTKLDNTKQYQTIDVLGLSLGGVLASYLSQRFLFNHLYLLAPALDLQYNIHCWLVIARVLLRLGFVRIRNRAGNILTPDQFELAYRQQSIHGIIEVFTLILNYKQPADNIPTDIFLGRYDQLIDNQKILTRFKHSANTKIHWLEQSAHVLPLDNDYNMIADIINITTDK